MKVGVIGLGNMGMGAALNLLHKGHDVTGCELREEIRAAFAAEGGKAVVSADALPPDLEAVVVFVINAAQTEQVLFGEKGCLARTQTGAVILCCATVAPEAAKVLGAENRGPGFLMIDSPVSGGLAGARAGTMTVMGSGSEAAFAKAAPVLEAISTKIWRLGDEIGVGSTVKMVNQLLAGVHIATAAEALALGYPCRRGPRDPVQGDLRNQPAVPGCGRTASPTSWPATTRRPPPSTSSSRTWGSCLTRQGPDLPAAHGRRGASPFLAAAANGQGPQDDLFGDPGVGQEPTGSRCRRRSRVCP